MVGWIAVEIQQAQEFVTKFNQLHCWALSNTVGHGIELCGYNTIFLLYRLVSQND